MKYLYAYMHPCDIVSYDVEVIASYVRQHSICMRMFHMQKQVPAELFFTYVLCVRVNNEDLDKSREWITDSLLIALRIKRQW